MDRRVRASGKGCLHRGSGRRKSEERDQVRAQERPQRVHVRSPQQGESFRVELTRFRGWDGGVCTWGGLSLMLDTECDYQDIYQPEKD